MYRKNPSNNQNDGFTIVELLIVIVVIGILAAITVVAYNGMQQRARDSIRASDAKNIVKALESYKTLNGRYPLPTPTGGSGAFEQSTDTPGTFLEFLLGDYFSVVPVDPINNASRYYRYYVYQAGSLAAYGCPTDKGNLLVFYSYGYEVSGNAPDGDSSLVCTGRTWSGSNSTTYFYYSFEAGK